MTKFILMGSKQVDGDGRKEEAYTYRSVDGTKRIVFRAHSKKAFVYVELENSNVSKTEFTALVNAFTKAGMKQHQFQGGWDEAISTLEIK